jgi:glycosyltransferase involved in cell wall biosynthesis
VIALVHGAPAWGAVEEYVLTLGEALRDRGVPAALLYPDVPALQPFAALAGGSVAPRPFRAELAGSASRSTRFLLRELRRLRPDVVHVTDVWPSGQIAGRLARPRRLLVTHHTPELPRRDNVVGRLWWRAGWAVRPEVVYTSETDRRTDSRWSLSTHVVALGIELGRFAAPPRRPRTDAPVIGNVARLAEQKGQRDLLAAAEIVLERYPRASFVVVGEGELRGELEELAAQPSLSGRVTLLGARNDVPALLAGLDVFAFPSRFEGLCLAVIEAQAAGVPVVATPVGGIRETVVDGVTGLLVPPREPAALAAGILRLLDDPAAAQRLAEEAQRRVRDRFSVERMVAETLALYA